MREKLVDLNARFVRRMVIDGNHQPNQFAFFTMFPIRTVRLSRIHMPTKTKCQLASHTSHSANMTKFLFQWHTDRFYSMRERFGRRAKRAPNQFSGENSMPLQWINNMLNDGEQ